MPIEQVANICDIQLFKRPLYYVYYKGDNFNETEMFATSGAGQQGKRDFTNSEVWDNLYFDSYLQVPFKNKTLGEQDKYIMEYSPFGLFVVVNLDEETEDMNYSILHSRLNSNSPTGYHDYEEETHNDHFGEGNMIDRWLMEMGPEEELFYIEPEEGEEPSHVRKLKDIYYILDPWMNKIYMAPKREDRENSDGLIGDAAIINNMFKIRYNGNTERDLHEENAYSLSLEDGDLKTLKLGIGVYAQVLYSKVTATLEPTDLDGSIKAKKEAWEAIRATGDLVKEREKYGEYIEAVQSAVGEELAPNKNNYYMRPYLIKAGVLDMLEEDKEDKLISFNEALEKLEQKLKDGEISREEYNRGLNILKNWDINW